MIEQAQPAIELLCTIADQPFLKQKDIHKVEIAA
jgi:hypothetical protein